MRHIRSDYDPIQDPRGKIPEDEPVFLIRGQDPCAPDTLRAWAYLAELDAFHDEDDGKHEAAAATRELVAATRRWAEEMERYQSKMETHSPDAPAGAIRA